MAEKSLKKAEEARAPVGLPFVPVTEVKGSLAASSTLPDPGAPKSLADGDSRGSIDPNFPSLSFEKWLLEDCIIFLKRAAARAHQDEPVHDSLSNSYNSAELQELQ